MLRRDSKMMREISKGVVVGGEMRRVDRGSKVLDNAWNKCSLNLTQVARDSLRGKRHGAISKAITNKYLIHGLEAFLYHNLIR
jgi:hypothetical protein